MDHTLVSHVPGCFLMVPPLIAKIMLSSFQLRDFLIILLVLLLNLSLVVLSAVLELPQIKSSKAEKVGAPINVRAVHNVSALVSATVGSSIGIGTTIMRLKVSSRRYSLKMRTAISRFCTEIESKSFTVESRTPSLMAIQISKLITLLIRTDSFIHLLD